MTLAISNLTGDGVNATLISFSVQMPDAFPDVISFTGYAIPATGANAGKSIGLTGSPTAGVAVPGSGITYGNLQVDPATASGSPLTAAVTLQTSSSGDPAPISSTAVTLFRFQIPAASTDPALLAIQSTPDSW